MIIWLTGQPGSGKTTICKCISDSHGRRFVHVDGDDIRDLFENKDYSEGGRRRNVELAQMLARFMHTKGMDVLVSLVSPYRDQREAFKLAMGPGILEAYVHTTETRGREGYFAPGYQPPLSGFLDVDTTGVSPEECAEKIIRAYEERTGEVLGRP